jgi:hypothetical protein
MEEILHRFLAALACLIPLVIVMYLIVRKRRARRARSKAPFSELRRRPAGEFLRLKIELLNEKLNDYAMLVAAFPTGLAVWLVSVGWTSIIFPAGAFLLSLAWVGIWGWKLNDASRARTNYQLGFDGERYVAEELTRLMAHGFEIYHDVQFDKFNIDHILVGPPGVFAVETKTHRKPIDASGSKEYKVEFDGSRLHWPWGKDKNDVTQTIRNAQSVAQWLSGSVGEPVLVVPILTLPGWLVNRNASQPTVPVLNPKEIVKFCHAGRQHLSENLLQRIRFQLDQKCRLEVE